MHLRVGIAESLPKLAVRRLLEPALSLPEQVRLICREDRPERLLAALSAHELDVVLSDAPVGPSVKTYAFNHQLGESGISFFGTAGLAAIHRGKFPRCLDGAPVLFPGEQTDLRRALEQWLDEQGIRPRVVGEFDDSALLKAFGQRGAGFFPAPSIIEADVRRQYQVRVIGRVDVLRERYFAISAERKLKHPAVVAITNTARETTFR